MAQEIIKKELIKDNSKDQSVFMGFIKSNWLLVVAILYLILPFDFVFDSIPILGQIDDLGIFLVNLIKMYLDYKKENEKAKS